MNFSPVRLGPPPPATPKGTWRSKFLTAFQTPLRCIQNALKPALRVAELDFPPTSRNQGFEASKIPVLNASKAQVTEVSAWWFARQDFKEATTLDTKGAMA